MSAEPSHVPSSRAERRGLEWRVERCLVAYPEALGFMERRAAAVREGTAPELVWLLEHPPLITAGTSANPADLVDPDRFPVYDAGRGGQYTYHGPGQRVAYCVLDLKRRGPDLRRYVRDLEEWVIRTLASFGIEGERRDGRVGIWVRDNSPSGESKVAAIGVRVRRWVAYHGLSLNVDPDLSHFGAIVPCGIAEHGVTSLKALGVGASTDEVDAALAREFEAVFGAQEKA